MEEVPLLAATDSAPASRVPFSPAQKSILKQMLSFWFREKRANLEDIVALARKCLGDEDETRRLFLQDKEFSWHEIPAVCSYIQALKDLIPQTAELNVLSSHDRCKIRFRSVRATWTIDVACNWSLRSVLQHLTTLPIHVTTLFFGPLEQSEIDLFTTEMNLCQQDVQQQQQQQQQDRSDLSPSSLPRNFFSEVDWLLIDETHSSAAVENFTSFLNAIANQCVNLKTLDWRCNSLVHEVPTEDTWAKGLLPLKDRLRVLHIYGMRRLTPIVAQFLRGAELLHKLELVIGTYCTVHNDQMMQLCKALENNKSVTSFHLSRRGDDGDDALEAAHTNRLIRVFREGLNTTVKDYTGICKIEIQHWCTMNQVKRLLRQDGVTAMDVVESLHQHMSNDAILYCILRFRPELWCNIAGSTRKRRQSQA